MSTQAKSFVTSVIALGLLIALDATTHWRLADLPQFLMFLALSIVGSILKVGIPGTEGTYSLGFPFLLLTSVSLSQPEAVAIGVACTLAQCLWRPRVRPSPVKIAFSVANTIISIAAAGALFALIGRPAPTPAIVAMIAPVYFIVNTALLSGAISMTEGQPFRSVSQRLLIFAFPVFLIGIVAAAVVTSSHLEGSWRTSAAMLPLTYLTYLCYKAIVSSFQTGLSRGL